jgi:hypothetical protein
MIVTDDFISHRWPQHQNIVDHSAICKFYAITKRHYACKLAALSSLFLKL